MPLMKRMYGVATKFLHWGPTEYKADEKGFVEVRKEHMNTAIAHGFVAVVEPQVREKLHLKK